MNLLIKQKKFPVVILSLFLSLTANALIEYDQDVTPDVIFGTGNSNGLFTTDRNAVDKVEVALRAKIPFSPGVTRTINSNGDGTYSYTLAETDHDEDANTPNRWNFEFSVNVDYLDATSSGANLDELTYEMGLDADPSLATNFLIADPITPVGGNFDIAPDHSFGNNMTANGAGIEPLAPLNFLYRPLYEDNNVVQNSSSYFFLMAVPPINTYDPSVPGTYDIYLIVKLAGVEVARTDIQVLIGGGAPNEAPVTIADNYIANEDVSLSINNPNGVLANDTDIDGDTLQVVEVGTIIAVGGIGGSIIMAADGTFNYTPPLDFNGVATFNFTVSDGSLTTPSSVTITLNAVNDAPSFVKGADQTTMEDTGAQTINMWATAISAGPVDESSQVLSFNLSNDNNTLFNVQPVVDPSGNLSYTPAIDANGSATISINIMDDGATVNGGVDTSADQSFTITVTAVNDAPEFDILGDQIFIGLANNTVQVAGFANNIVLEPNGGEGQLIDAFTVIETVDTQNIINSAMIDSSGDLNLDFNINNYGTAIFSVQLKDNGGVLNSGQDTSIVQNFNISHIPDGVFSDGFEQTTIVKVFKLIAKSYDSTLFASIATQDLPYYDSQSDSVMFLGHKLQLHGDYESLQISTVLQQWINELLVLEEVK